MRLDPLLVPDWRDASAYEALLEADRCAFAWEWLRRDPNYRAAAYAALGGNSAVGAGASRPEDWGLYAFERPHRPTPRARPMWTRTVHPQVLTAQAVQLPPTDFDLTRFAANATLLVGSGGERLLLSDGLRFIRIDLSAGTLRKGPRRLRFLLDNSEGVDAAILALRRFIVLRQTGAFSRELHGPGPRGRRLQLLLRTADAIARGASQREIAEALLVPREMPAAWRDELPTVRMQVRRLVRGAAQMQAGGYRSLLL